MLERRKPCSSPHHYPITFPQYVCMYVQETPGKNVSINMCLCCLICITKLYIVYHQNVQTMDTFSLTVRGEPCNCSVWGWIVRRVGFVKGNTGLERSPITRRCFRPTKVASAISTFYVARLVALLSN